jgi:hypothetical protein
LGSDTITYGAKTNLWKCQKDRNDEPSVQPFTLIHILGSFNQFGRNGIPIGENKIDAENEGIGVGREGTNETKKFGGS